MEYENNGYYFVNANEKSITHWNTFYYKGINYLKTIKYLLD